MSDESRPYRQCFDWDGDGDVDDDDARVYLSTHLLIRLTDPVKNPLPQAKCRIIGDADGTVYTGDENGVVSIPILEWGQTNVDLEWEPKDAETKHPSMRFFWKSTFECGISSKNEPECVNRLMNLGFYGETLNDQVCSYQSYFGEITTGRLDDIRDEMVDWHDGGEAKCTCAPCKENFPFGQEAFDLIAAIKDLIIFYSKKYDVPPIAVAGSIADEYNTRQGFKAFEDWVQDSVLLKFMPNFAIEFDAYLGFNSKLLNATRHDIGIGNINIQTAKDMYELYGTDFKNKNMNYADLVEYINSDEGTVHLAALVIKRARSLLDQYVQGYPDKKKEAAYVTYYKNGDSYLARFKTALQKDPAHKIMPGEGCRTCRQRDKFKTTLGL